MRTVPLYCKAEYLALEWKQMAVLPVPALTSLFEVRVHLAMTNLCM